MQRQRRSTIIVVGGALAIASVGYGLGTQAGDGTAIADNTSTEQDGGAQERGGAPPLAFERCAPPGIDSLAGKLGVDSGELADALRDYHDQHDADRRDEFAAALAKALGISSDRVTSALDDLRAKQEDRFAAKLANALNVETAKVKAALDELEGDRPRSPDEFAQTLADELGLDVSDVRDALMTIRPFGGPAPPPLGGPAPHPFGGPPPRAFDERGRPGHGIRLHHRAMPLRQLAQELGVSRADLRAAFRELRSGVEDHFKQEQEALAKFLADRFDLDVSKVQDALAAVLPPLRSPHPPGLRHHPMAF